MRETQNHAWFAAKRYGYGAGLPVRWEGWAVLGIYLVVTLVPMLYAARIAHHAVPGDRHTMFLVGGVIAFELLAAIVFLFITLSTTSGGWRWRWGDNTPHDEGRW